MEVEQTSIRSDTNSTCEYNPPLANNYWPPTPVSNTGSNSNPSYYSHYSNSFVKGGSLLPP